MVTPSSTKRSPETSPSTATTEEAAARRFVPVKHVVQHSPVVVAHNRKSDFSVLEVSSALLTYLEGKERKERVFLYSVIFTTQSQSDQA